MSDYQVKTFFLEAVREKTKVVGKDADAFSVFAKKRIGECCCRYVRLCEFPVANSCLNQVILGLLQ